ncbi:MAG: Eco57I restriction-modification methylase domain-containing protein, partial [Porphyromonas sp.]|nr:Eco57I restriction-modification methylase domain-containing protein [Porphyromonas sp.]
MAAIHTLDSLRVLFQSRFALESWYGLLIDLFGAKELKATPEKINQTASDEGYYLGSIDTSDSYHIGLFKYDVIDGSVANKRVGLRNLVRSFINPTWGEFDAALVVFDSGDHWRLSFICDIKGESTSPKRYTYVFGDNDSLYKTPVERFSLLKNKGEKKGVSFASLKDAFSVEALSKEFFDKYREHYADFVQYITGKRYIKKGNKWIETQINAPHPQLQEQFSGDEKRVRDYVKKLLGRIVFLHYLQRKGWLGVPQDKAWGEGDPSFIQHLFEYATEEQKANFIEMILEPLFYGALNTNRSDDGDLFDTQVEFPSIGTSSLRIPYLNGGLFEADENDELTIQFPPEYFKNIFDFFSQYNFTIDENDPSDAQVGVDPEMLGRIFESLLEDNKEKGAYYTPKEIVQYMCQESLTAYLCTGLDDEGDKEPREAIARFVKSNNAEDLCFQSEAGRAYDLRGELLGKLIDVKICDPAIGSGAFPMGLLRELYHCRMALEGQSVSPAEIKSQIIKNNIYGVDIERGAVDIARLRFWLSLVVDEETPRPLPNLDYKIMQGNSLLESYQGHDLSTILSGERIHYDSENNCRLLFAEDEESKNQVLLRQQLSSYYNCHCSAEKQALKEQIKGNINEQVELFRSKKGVQRALFDEAESKRKKVAEQEVLDLSDIDVMANPHFFLWHTWFDDVFNRPSGGNGFDIVIGNPPYIQLLSMEPGLKKTYENCGYSTFTGRGDIYCLFYERGWQLLKKDGLLCYITSNKWLRADYGKDTRAFFANKTNPMLLIDFAGVKIFESATVDTNILLFAKSNNQHKTICAVTNKQNKDSVKNLSDFVQQQSVVCDFDSSDSWLVLSPIEQSIKRKIEAVGTPLKDWDIQ